MFLTPWQKHFLFMSNKICFRNTCFPRGEIEKHLHPQQYFRNDISATMFPSLARPFILSGVKVIINMYFSK